jgi:hypothetical protein
MLINNHNVVRKVYCAFASSLAVVDAMAERSGHGSFSLRKAIDIAAEPQGTVIRPAIVSFCLFGNHTVFLGYKKALFPLSEAILYCSNYINLPTLLREDPKYVCF